MPTLEGLCDDTAEARLDASTLTLAVEIASIPEDIRGYGHVKARHLAAARPRWDALMARWRQPGTDAARAA